MAAENVSDAQMQVLAAVTIRLAFNVPAVTTRHVHISFLFQSWATASPTAELYWWAAAYTGSVAKHPMISHPSYTEYPHCTCLGIPAEFFIAKLGNKAQEPCHLNSPMETNRSLSVSRICLLATFGLEYSGTITKLDPGFFCARTEYNS